MLLTLLACEPEATDTAEEIVPIDTYEPPECETLEIRHAENEPDPAHVGDSWTLILWCGDDTILAGASRIILTPLEAGSLDENVVTWEQSGDVEIFMQTGTIKTSQTFTILD